MSTFSRIYMVGSGPEQFTELSGAARAAGGKTSAIYVGDGDAGPAAFGAGAEKLLHIAAKPGQIFENYAATIARAVKNGGEGALVLLVADKRGRAMAAKLGVALDACVVNDVTSMNEGRFERMVYGGLAQGVEKPSTDFVVATIAPGAFEQARGAAATGETVEVEFVEPAAKITLRETLPREASSVNIGLARRLLGVGRGFAKKEDLALARAFADAINAELACSRPIAEGEHWMERERYIGVSGMMVKPEVYLAVGISGQIQHMVGVRDAKLIIAVNKDKNAPIFGAADYGLVGDLYKILPALTRAFGQ